MDRYGYGDGKPGNPSVGYVATTQLKDIKKRLPLRVLSSPDWEHSTTWGYVVVKERDPRSEHPVPGRPAVGIPGNGPARPGELVQAAAARQ